MLRDDSGNGGGRPNLPRNVLGEQLDLCSIGPLNGFFRGGCFARTCSAGLPAAAAKQRSLVGDAWIEPTTLRVKGTPGPPCQGLSLSKRSSPRIRHGLEFRVMLLQYCMRYRICQNEIGARHGYDGGRYPQRQRGLALAPSFSARTAARPDTAGIRPVADRIRGGDDAGRTSQGGRFVTGGRRDVARCGRGGGRGGEVGISLAAGLTRRTRRHGTGGGSQWSG